MKALVVLLAGLLHLSAEVQADPPTTVQASFNLLRQSKIPDLNISEKSFDEAFEVIKKEWQKIHPESSFPVALTEFEPPIDGERAQGGRVTLRLKDVPFHEALIYLAESSAMRLTEHSGLINLEEVRAIIEDWSTRTYPVDKDLLEKLGLNKTSTKDEVRAAYARYEIVLEDWMTIGLDDQILVMTAYPGHHAYVRALHHFLRSGFSLVRPRKPNVSENPKSTSD